MDRRPVTALAEHLEVQRRVWVRVAANRPEGDWQLSVLEITTGEPPPQWRRVRWCYASAAFVASSPAGRTVATWLRRDRIPLPSGSVRLGVDDYCSVDRRGSRVEGIYEKLPWPTHEWTVHTNDTTRQVLHDELVGSDAPAFINFDQAAGAFLGVELVRNRNFSGREIVARQQDRRARIDSVRVGPAAVAVAVSGEQLGGTVLTLSGAHGPRKQLSARTREVRLSVPYGLAPGAWLALHRRDELLDRRILDPSWGGSDFEVEVEASTRIETLISGGERAVVEFKRQLPGSDPSGIMKTVAAFANGIGGTVLFGVENDGRVLGLGEESTARTVDRLTNMVSDWVRPLPDFECQTVEVGGRSVIAIEVSPGTGVPYGIGTTDRDIRYYVRRGATTFPATPADVRAFVRARLAVPEAL
jgi:hypothetical protein